MRVMDQGEGMTDPAEHENALTAAVLRMRRVGEPEAPFTGWLARVDGTVFQLVDTAGLRHWPGWHPRGEHVLAVHDVVRTVRGGGANPAGGATSADGAGPAAQDSHDESAGYERPGQEIAGHEAVLPWCVERVDAFLARRRSLGAELSRGETVTIVVSLLRGCVASRGARLTGAWWLTHDGTPTFVCACADGAGGGDTISEAAASLIDELARSGAVTGAWRLPEVASVVREGGDIDSAEADLFARASPEPLVLAPLTPRRATEARRGSVIEVIESERGASLWARLLARHVDPGVGEMVSDAIDGARRATERVRRRVARPWLVAAGIAGLIVVGGLAWPTSTAPPASARPVASDSPASLSPDGGTPEPADPETVARADSDPLASSDPVVALGAALDVLGSCGATPCGGALFEDRASTDLPPGAVDLPSARRSIALLDDLGGVAILSVSAADGAAPAQLVVLVRAGQRWLIRDVRDVEGS